MLEEKSKKILTSYNKNSNKVHPVCFSKYEFTNRKLAMQKIRPLTRFVDEEAMAFGECKVWYQQMILFDAEILNHTE